MQRSRSSNTTNIIRRRPSSMTVTEKFVEAWKYAELKEEAFLVASDAYGIAEADLYALRRKQHCDPFDRQLVLAKERAHRALDRMNQASQSALVAHGRLRNLYLQCSSSSSLKNENFYGSFDNFQDARRHMLKVDHRLEQMRVRTSQASPQEAPKLYGALMRGMARRDHRWKTLREHWTSSC